MGVWQWSQTADDNNDADDSINLRENASPSTYNNAVRGVMAMVKKWYDDISGNLVTGGTSTAITITTNTAGMTLTDGVFVRARITTLSGATPTLAVDGAAAKPIQSKSGTAIATGALVAGSIAMFTYDSNADAWIVSDRFGDSLTTGDNPDLVAIEALAGTTGGLTKTAANTWALDNFTTTITFEKDNNGTVLPVGIMGDSPVDFACTITGVKVFGDQSGSCVIDIWKDSYANYPPTVADTIVAAAKPTISSTTKYTDATLTGWTLALAAGDTIRWNLDSVTSFTRLTIALKVKRFT